MRRHTIPFLYGPLLNGPFYMCQDGFEMTWAVNVAAPFLLTACLLEAVRERVVVVSSISAASSIDWGNLQQARINCLAASFVRVYWLACRLAVTMVCILHRTLQLGWTLCFVASNTSYLVQGDNRPTVPRSPQERGFSSHNAYSLSKLAEQLFTFELADRLRAAGSPLTCNCLDPGGQLG